MEISVALHNVRSAYNVGAILRTMEGFGVKTALFSGYTPVPHDKRLLPYLADKLTRQIDKTALGAGESIECRVVKSLQAEIAKLKKNGWLIVGLENNLNDLRLRQINDSKLKTQLRGQKILLVLGEEVAGISQELHQLIDWFLEIPMQGRKESFNVSVATGIALYQLSLL